MDFSPKEPNEVFWPRRIEMQFLYKVENKFVMMDTTTYDQVQLEEKTIGPAVKFLKEGLEGIIALRFEDRIIGVELTGEVGLEVTEITKSAAGDTTYGDAVLAILETGAKIVVPLRVKPGDTIRVDTRASSYVMTVIDCRPQSP